MQDLLIAPITSTRSQLTRTFFKTLYADTTGSLLVWTRNRSTGSKVSHWYNAGDWHAITEAVHSHADGGSDVYYQTGLLAAPKGPHERGKEAEVVAYPAIHADIDVLNPAAHKAVNLPPTTEDAQKLLPAIPLPPTLLIQSGNGLQAYWVFTRPIVIDDLNRAAVKALQSDLQHVLQHAAAAKGWKVDGTADLVRVLRVPGSLNHKTAPPKPVRVIGEASDRYGFEQLREAIDSVSPDEDILDAPTPAPRTPAPRAEQPAAPAGMQEDDRLLLAKAFAAKNGQKVQALYEQPTAEGARSEAYQSLVNLLYFWQPNHSQLRRLIDHSWLGRNYDKHCERDDYFDRSFEKAAAKITETYKPRTEIIASATQPLEHEARVRIPYENLGPVLLACAKHDFAADRMNTALPESWFVYSSLVANAVILDPHVTSQLVRRESSQQNYLVFAAKGLGKSQLVDHARSTLLSRLANLPKARLVEVGETITPEKLVTTIGYPHKFNFGAELEKEVAKRKADAKKMHLPFDDAKIDKGQLYDDLYTRWEEAVDRYCASRKYGSVWFAREAAQAATVALGTSSFADKGGKFGAMCLSLDPFGQMHDKRESTGDRKATNICLSALWATQPIMWGKVIDRETADASGFFDRFVPVTDARPLYAAPDPAAVEIYHTTIAAIKHNSATVLITFDQFAGMSAPDLLDWELSLPVVQRAAELDRDWATDGVRKWFGHAVRLAHHRAIAEKLRLDPMEMDANAKITVDASEYLGPCLEFIAAHYYLYWHGEIVASTSTIRDELRLLVRTLYHQWRTDEDSRKRLATEVNADDTHAFVSTKEVLQRWQRNKPYKQRRDDLTAICGQGEIDLVPLYKVTATSRAKPFIRIPRSTLL